MKNFKKLILLASFLGFALPVWSDCGKHVDDSRYRSLDWHKAAIYRVNSPYADVTGLLCVGLSGDRLSRVHYRDTQGVKVYKTRKDLAQKDVVFFGQDDFPAAARWVMREEDALTLRLVKEKASPDGTYSYDISAKFLRNPRKGFSAADIREILLNFSTAYGETSYKGEALDEIYLNINASLTINYVTLKKNGRIFRQLNPYVLPKAVRR